MADSQAQKGVTKCKDLRKAIGMPHLLSELGEVCREDRGRHTARAFVHSVNEVYLATLHMHLNALKHQLQ